MTAATATKPRRGIRPKDGDVLTQFPGTVQVQILHLEAIVLDGGLQFRADGLDADYVAQLADLYASGATLPPVDVFGNSPQLYWVADGHHRVAAAKAAGLDQINVVIHDGDRAQARLHALRANANHGRRRTTADLQHAYSCCVAQGLCEAGDVARVVELLGCSERWARQITKEARDRVDLERNATIQRMAQEGKTQREIADLVGMSHVGVGKILGNKRNSSESYQDTRPPPGNRPPLNPNGLPVKPRGFQLQPSSPDPQPDPDSPLLQAAKAAFLALDRTDADAFCDWLVCRRTGVSNV